jgi:hypothetical protein
MATIKKTSTNLGGFVENFGKLSPANHPWCKIANGVATVSIPFGCYNLSAATLTVPYGVAEAGQLNRWFPFVQMVPDSLTDPHKDGSITFQVRASFCNGKLWPLGAYIAKTVLKTAKPAKSDDIVPEADKATA